VWKCESQGFDFTLDINPQIDVLVSNSAQGYSKRTLYTGEYLENGKLISVYVSVFDPTNTLGIFYVSKIDDNESEERQGSATTYYTNEGMIEIYSDDKVHLLFSSYLVIDGRLRLKLTKEFSEKHGIDELYLDLIKEYDTSDQEANFGELDIDGLKIPSLAIAN
jgi:hypothetical protein